MKREPIEEEMHKLTIPLIIAAAERMPKPTFFQEISSQYPATIATLPMNQNNLNANGSGALDHRPLDENIRRK